ncbi:VOC family protein [Sphaerimonospora mesophila]
MEFGATKPQFQPGDGWIVLADPEGHLFCVCPERS